MAIPLAVPPPHERACSGQSVAAPPWKGTTLRLIARLRKLTFGPTAVCEIDGATIAGGFSDTSATHGFTEVTEGGGRKGDAITSGTFCVNDAGRSLLRVLQSTGPGTSTCRHPATTRPPCGALL